MAKGKKPLSLSIETEIFDLIENFANQHNFSGISAAANTIFRTFFAEFLDKEVNIPPKDVTLIPRKTYQKAFDLTIYYIDQRLKDGDVKSITIFDNEYLFFNKDEEEMILTKLNDVVPVSNMITNIYSSLSRIGEKVGISLFDPYIAFNKFKESDKYTPIIDSVYADILMKINDESKKDVLFFQNATCNSILSAMGEDFKQEDAKKLAIPLIEFILKTYKEGKWE